MVELPLVVAMIQRAGPSTGMPTKTEQADLLQAMFGRNGECPVAIVAPATPSDCFDFAIEALRIAITHMTPVIFLSDGYLGNGSEPWRIPDVSRPAEDRGELRDRPGDVPAVRARPRRRWRGRGRSRHAGLEHRIGGLEKADITGNVSYDAENHDQMVRLRAEKIERIAHDIPDWRSSASRRATLLVLGWGSTYGADHVGRAAGAGEGQAVSHAHCATSTRSRATWATC